MRRWHFEIHTVLLLVLLVFSLVLAACAPEATLSPTVTTAVYADMESIGTTAAGPAVLQATSTAQPAGSSSPTTLPLPANTAAVQARSTTAPTSLPTTTAAPTSTLAPTLTSTALPTNTSAPTLRPTTVPTSTQPPASLQGVTACIPPQEPQQATVTRIVDGDTIHVSLNGQDYTVRYIGMDTPEDTTKVEYFGPEATEANRALVAGKTVLLYKDVSETDRYGRLLRFVVIPGDPPVFVNYELVRRGFANTTTYPPDVACAETYRAAEAQARQEGVGLWGAQPAPTATTVQAGGGNCDPSYPDVCIAPPPPDLDCKDIPYRRFKVLPPDPHHFDSDHDGIGCES